jgi:hypothetical protein
MVSGVDVGVGLDDVVMSGNVLALVQYARSPLTSLPPSRTGLRAGRSRRGVTIQPSRCGRAGAAGTKFGLGTGRMVASMYGCTASLGRQAEVPR